MISWHGSSVCAGRWRSGGDGGLTFIAGPVPRLEAAGQKQVADWPAADDDGHDAAQLHKRDWPIGTSGAYVAVRRDDRSIADSRAGGRETILERRVKVQVIESGITSGTASRKAVWRRAGSRAARLVRV